MWYLTDSSQLNLFCLINCSCKLEQSVFLLYVFASPRENTPKSTARMNSCREIMNRCVHMTNVAQLKCANMHILLGVTNFKFYGYKC